MERSSPVFSMPPSPPTSPPPVQRILGPYAIVQSMYSSNHVSVDLAIHRLTNVKYALKRYNAINIRGMGPDGADIIRDIGMEIQVLAQ